MDEFNDLETYLFGESSDNLKQKKAIRRSESSVSEQEWLPESFPTTGTRVILNPESKEYNYTIENIGSDAGYVINQRASMGDLHIILTNGKRHIPSWRVLVRFDNGKEKTIHVNQLLIVDGRGKTVTQYNVGHGEVFCEIEGEQNRYVAEQIIKNRHYVQEAKVYDEKYRNQCIAEAYEKLGK